MVNGGKIEAVKVQLPVMTMPSRLPQKRDSKIPSPNQSSTIHTAKNSPSQCSSSIGKKSLSSLSNKSLSFIGKASRSSSLSSSVSSTSLYAGGCNDIGPSSTAATASTTTSTASATNINSSNTSVTQFTRSIRPPRSSLPGTLPTSSPAKLLSVLHTRSSVPGRGAASNSVYGLKGRPVKREESSPSPRASPVTEPKSCRISIRSSVTTGSYGSPKLSPANQMAFSGPQENTLRSSFRKESQKPSLKPKPLTRSIGIPLPKSAKTIPSSSGINSIQAQTTPSRINSPISMNGAKISASSFSSPRSDLNAKKMASVMKKSEENVLSLCSSGESNGKTDTHQETIKSSPHIEPSIVCASVSANKLESNVARVSPIRRGGSIVKQTVLNYNQNDVKLLRPRISTPEPSKETGKDSPESCATNTYEPSEPESDKDTVKSDNLCTKSSQKESQSHHNHNSKKPITDDGVVASSSDLVYLSVVKDQQQVDSTELTKLVDDDNLSSSEKSTSEPVILSNLSPPSFPLPPPPPPPPLTSLTGCNDEAHQISKSPPPIPERTLSPTKSRPDSGSLSPSSSSSSSASSATESSSISIDTESSIGCETNPTIKFPLFESMTMDNSQRPQSLSLQSMVNRRPKCSLFSDLDFVTPARYERRSDIGSHEFKSEHKYPPIHVGPSHQLPTDLNGSSATPPPLGLTASLNGFKRLSKTGEYRGSAASLLSNSSSFSANEERQSFEIKKLKDELNRAHIKVETLTSQLKSSNEMIQTFGQSLETLRTRLHQCSLTTEQKDREINRLKSTIENLRNECSSLDNGCGVSEGGDEFPSDIESRRERLKKRPKEPRSPSTDREEPGSGWFRGSITRAFGKKNRARNKICSSNGEVECANGLTKDYDSASLPGTPIIGTKCLGLSTIMNGNSISTVNIFEEFDGEMVSSLKKQLREKEKQLNDIRLEALLTASQMESINEKVNRMTKEMINLRNENQCLQSMLQKQSTTSNTHSLTNFCDITYMNQQGRKVFLKILGKPIGYVIVDPKIDRNLLDIHIRRVFDEFLAKIHSEKLGISSDCLKSYSCDDEFISRHSKTDENGNNSSLPCIESLIKHNSVNLELKSKLDCLAIDLNTPKSTLDKLVNVLRESGRLIICGPAHCGKSYLASKVCQFVLQERLDSDSNVMSINVRRDENCRKEIESLVKNILFCEKSSLPGAIVFKNIHNMPEFSSLLSSVKSVRSPLPIIVCTMSAYDSSRCSTLTDMQLCHNFQSVLFCETNEPCKSFISRVLRRRAIDEEIDATFKGTSFNFQLLSRVIDWLERLHHHIDSIIGDILSSSSNSSLFTSQDFYTKVFLSCPLNHETSRDWFIETWNCKIFPNIQKIIENHNTSTLTSTTHNSSDIFEHFPWPTGRELCFKIQSTQEPSLEYPCKSKTDSITNQLHDTLMRLQEATNG